MRSANSALDQDRVATLTSAPAVVVMAWHRRAFLSCPLLVRRGG
jgi:hypothetical protein